VVGTTGYFLTQWIWKERSLTLRKITSVVAKTREEAA
jgi:hypothetical protein